MEAHARLCGQFGAEDTESVATAPPPLYQQQRFWALAVPCAFTAGMLTFGVTHLIIDPNEVPHCRSHAVC
jgi:hypothetical protein